MSKTATKQTQPKENFADVYARVTDKILADLAAGVRPWMKPWSSQNAEGKIIMPLRANGTPYRGINVLMLWGAAMLEGFTSPRWMTYHQATELGAQVRKGSKGCLVVYANSIKRTETNEKTGEDEEKEIPFMKGYTVFNVEQIDDLPEEFLTRPEPVDPFTIPARLEALDRFFAATGATIRHGGGRAFFAPAQDLVQMPPFEAFRDRESYYSTLAHEMTHWTGHNNRLARDLKNRFGSQAYAAEELIAEIGSAFLCAKLGITPETREDHAAYVENWLKVLKQDKRAIFTAAAAAQRAADFLDTFQQA